MGWSCKQTFKNRDPTFIWLFHLKNIRYDSTLGLFKNEQEFQVLIPPWNEHFHPVGNAYAPETLRLEDEFSFPKTSMYGTFTYVWLILMVNVGVYIWSNFIAASHDLTPRVCFPRSTRIWRSKVTLTGNAGALNLQYAFILEVVATPPFGCFRK